MVKVGEEVSSSNAALQIYRHPSQGLAASQQITDELAYTPLQKKKATDRQCDLQCSIELAKMYGPDPHFASACSSMAGFIPKSRARR